MAESSTPFEAQLPPRRPPGRPMEPESHDLAQSRRYEAAESMLQHARKPRTQQQLLNGLVSPENHSNGNVPPQQLNPSIGLPTLPYHNLLLPIESPQDEQAHSLLDQHFRSPQDSNPRSAQYAHQPFAAQPQVHSIVNSEHDQSHLASGALAPRRASATPTGPANRTASVSQVDSQALPTKDTVTGQAGKSNLAKKSSKKSSIITDEDEKPPPWSELKTKAGKDRKRLPLACIACRRKKIRCSGEKPACKHCLRSRIPCVYKVTTRKAAPRTDYMAMLDKRLKRMEERVIKIVPEDEASSVSTTTRAQVRPVASMYSALSPSGRKRAAEEAFGPDLEGWASKRLNKKSLQGQKSVQKKTLTEGSDKLPPREIQEHLADVFFDCLYGQTYLLLHKPTFMQRLRAGNAPPVLVLAVCAVAARFSTHPQIKSEPAFMRGEEWAAPAREMALNSYDQPSITILTVLLLLGLHEFGTCQGGRSWMFCGMAMRMAYALQLHREVDHDPLGRKDDADPKLSATDREIRRRTMWACLLMDRFNSSGTDRPTCGNEENIEVQLPTKEFNFQNEIPGPTEMLNGDLSTSTAPDAEHSVRTRDNMGVASYMVRIIVIWGRVVKYLSLGGKERDPFDLWHPQSGFNDLRIQAESFRASLIPDLLYNAETLANHAAEKLGNQFLLLHICYHQVVLFLHRYVIPTMNPGVVVANEMPQDFASAAAQVAVEAAGEISNLISHAAEHNLVAPFAGYCAFTSSTVLIWTAFAGQPPLQESARRNLNVNVKYIRKMKAHWGVFHFMADNLKETWKWHSNQMLRKDGNGHGAASKIFQYGDWFRQYPNGPPTIEYDGDDAPIKIEDGASPNSDLQRINEAFNQTQLPARAPQRLKRKQSRPAAVQTTVHPPQVLPHDAAVGMSLQSMTAMAPPTPVAPSPFSPNASQSLYSSFPAPTYDVLSQGLSCLDRNLVYDACLQTPGPSISSIDSSFQPLPAGDQTAGVWESAVGDLSAPFPGLGPAGSYMGDVQQSSAWFMPFNMPLPMFGEDKGGFGGFRSEGGHQQ
ncbi:MAG: hypothetical protein Q9203_002985 [Teloschistes exilis]